MVIFCVDLNGFVCRHACITRMQFVCASPTPSNDCVWVCKSDADSGQICLLSIDSGQPTLISCNSTSSNIACMAKVPGSTKTYKTNINEIVATNVKLHWTNRSMSTSDSDDSSLTRSESTKDTFVSTSVFGREGSNRFSSSSVRDTFSNYSNAKQLNGKMIM